LPRLDEKREVRMRRRNLKESGDFLGVQGANPDTGEYDLLTPTTSSGSEALPRGAAPSLVRRRHIGESRARDHKIAKLPRRVVWRRDENQWSSVAEPDLSPIEQSQNSSGNVSGMSPLFAWASCC
jgi:hypothetical protein